MSDPDQPTFLVGIRPGLLGPRSAHMLLYIDGQSLITRLLPNFTKPMAQHNERLRASPAVLANPDWVIRPSFCASESAHVDLEIFKTPDGDYIVEDVNRKSIVLKVEGKLFKFHDGVRLNDADGNPVVTLRKKKATAHARWQVFNGHSIDSNDLLFTGLKSSMFQFKTKLHVFLANNTAEDVFDFKVKESCTHDSCSICAGDASTIVAEMDKKFDKSGEFIVNVHPKMDYAFATTIILILDRMKSSIELKKVSSVVLSTVSTISSIVWPFLQS